ncbi:sensor histidine kinase [Sinimarinibacterium thermocellulolyticum]|uniref:histidine kinase n=1 Tax=Sinimarinibacterium thermocellulolyticum TaxID=3170016 RepID=A0ABV2ABM3_9GAMM
MTPRAGRGLALRLTLLNAAIVGLALLAVVVVMVWMAERAMREHLAESVAAEIEVLVADYLIDGLDGVIGFIEHREVFESPHHGRSYRLEDTTGRHLAGHWPDWPAGLSTDGRLLRLPNAQRQPPTQWWIAAARLPDGSRVLVAFDSIEVRSVMHTIHRAAALTVAASLILALVLGMLIYRAALAPIATVRSVAEQIIDGDLSRRIPERGSGDEFDALARTLNRMLDRISQLFESLRNSTEAIAHDLRSPLARHRTRLEQALLEAERRGADADWLQEAIAEVDQVLGTFQSLLQLATVEAGAARSAFCQVDLAAIVEDAVSLYDADAAARGMRIETLLSAPCPLLGDRHLLFQAVINLIDNALKYGAAEQCVSVQLHCAAGSAELRVRNQGAGFEHPERAFERLFRGDTARRSPGHGMGLTLVRAIARLHGGEATASNCRDGAEVRIRLPIAPSA